MVKRMAWLALALVLLAGAGPGAAAQAVRWDSTATTTTGVGQSVPLLAIPGAAVTFYSCSGSDCSTLATTYNSVSEGTACPTSAQVVLQGTADCVSTADFQGNFGAWFAPGQYAYTLLVLDTLYGPYNFTLGGGSGGGSVNSVGLAAPTYFRVTGSPVTNSGTLTFTGATGLTANQVLKTGTAGTLGLGALATTDLPFTYTGNTTKLATSTGTLPTNDYPKFDANGNFVDSGIPTGGATSIGGVTITGTPATGDVPTATGPSTATWQPAGSGSSGYFTGTPTVNVAGTASNSSMVWVATSPTAAAPRQLTEDDILPGFSITGFSCSVCGNVEIGFSTSNPATFGASYSSTPASASISDGTHTDTLTTPFTSGSLAFAYTETTQASVTFTLTAVSSTTRTATQGINWLPRVFGGVGTAGATGATASGSSAVLVGATGTLSDQGLSSNGGLGTYGPFSPSGQKIYLLLSGTGHTFTSAGFNFPMNSPTTVSFANQYGATVTMYLYESTNLLNAPFTIQVN